MRKRKNELPYVELAIPCERFIAEVEKEIIKLSEDILAAGKMENKTIAGIAGQAVQNVFSGWFAVESEIKIQQFPLGSLAASGKAEIPGAGIKVYVQGTGKHIPYARKWVCPRNPQTPGQQSNRNLFKEAMQSWQAQPESIKTQWNLKAQTLGSLSGHNLYLRHWLAEKKRGE
jgi:hypothetical protein